MSIAGECIAGRYLLECPLGQGGMGSVWKARHLGLDAAVAIKFQHAHRASSPRAAARFRREARAAARLKNPNVVRVVDFGIDGDLPFIAMELLEGESLKARLERRVTASLEETFDLTRQAANALDAAHEAGIVHRDLKPSNLFIVTEGERENLKLLDFGIAQYFESDGEGITEDDLVVGSAQYMSPEQARGEVVDRRTDVWALGVVAYQLLTGVLPFQGANIPDTLRRLCGGRFEAPSSVVGSAFAPFDAVFARAFELDRTRRFGSAGELSVALSGAARELRPEVRSSHPLVPAGGWAFGRDGTTLSVPLAPAPARASFRRRALVPAALVLVAPALLVAASRLAPSTGSERAPSEVPATAPPKPSPSLDERKAATSERPLELAGTPAPAAPPTQSGAPAPRRKAPARSVAAPARSALEPPPAVKAVQVDPVFGLAVPAR